MQLYWNHTFLHGWSLVNLLRFCRIIFLNNTYGGLPLTFTLYKKHTVCCFLSLSTVHHNSSIPLLYKESHPYSLHSHPQFPAFPPWFPTSLTFPPWFPSFQTWFPAFPPWFITFPPLLLSLPPRFPSSPLWFPTVPL